MTPTLNKDGVDSPSDKDGAKWLQNEIGSLLYHAHAIDSTMLMALNARAKNKVHMQNKTGKHVLHFLDYIGAHLDIMI